jgi:hypothetical protein
MHGLLITTTGVVSLVSLSRTNTLGLIANTIRADSVYAEWLGPLVFWVDVGAALVSRPVFNVSAMWAMQQLRGPCGLPILWGDVVVTGRADVPDQIEPGPADLGIVHLELLHHALTGEL